MKVRNTVRHEKIKQHSSSKKKFDYTEDEVRDVLYTGLFWLAAIIVGGLFFAIIL